MVPKPCRHELCCPKVSVSALRLVQRMRRDWIQTGRRPSGICGAALLIASRVHGFRRTQREVVRIVRICDAACSERHLASATAHHPGLLGLTHPAPGCALRMSR